MAMPSQRQYMQRPRRLIPYTIDQVIEELEKHMRTMDAHHGRDSLYATSYREIAQREIWKLRRRKANGN